MVRHKLSATHAHHPVANLFGAAVAVAIRGRRQLDTKFGLKTGLLFDLVQRGGHVILTSIEFAFGQRPVAVLGPVHHQHLDGAVGARTPNDAAGGLDYIHARSLFFDASSHASGHAARAAAASRHCTPTSSPVTNVWPAPRNQCSATTASLRSPSTPCTSATAEAHSLASLTAGGMGSHA